MKPSMIRFVAAYFCCSFESAEAEEPGQSSAKPEVRLTEGELMKPGKGDLEGAMKVYEKHPGVDLPVRHGGGLSDNQ